MKKLPFLLLISGLYFFSCKDEVPEYYIEYQGKYYKESVPVRYDSNGDGKIDSADKTIEVLGNSLDVTQTPDGKPLFKTNDTLTSPGSPNGTGSLIPTGEKLCYLDLQRNCDKYGGLYAYETSMNASKTSMKTASESQQIDKDKDGILDYVETIRESQVTLQATNNYAVAAANAENLIEAAAKRQISTFLLETSIREAIENSLTETLYLNNESIDITIVEQKLNIAIAQAIIDAVKQAGLDAYIEETEIEEIAFSISQDVSKKIASDLSKTISTAIINDYNQQKLAGNIATVQGICPNGYHIPSDVEWMLFELALEMPTEDLTKSGEDVTTRGASKNVAAKMVKDHNFNYGGYGSINGTFSQLGEAGVYWSSTIGTDTKGEYVWVRQIDTSYSGVIRYKHYEKSGLSIRCFKN